MPTIRSDKPDMSKDFQQFRAKVLRELAEAVAEPVTDYPTSGPGAILPLPRALLIRRGLPETTKALVLARDSDAMVVCPLILSPHRKLEHHPADCWLESELSPFRSLPGTGRALVRPWASVEVPATFEAEDVLTGLSEELLEPFSATWRGATEEPGGVFSAWLRSWEIVALEVFRGAPSI